MTHDKFSFVREYCLARKIPYKFKKESLYIDKNFVWYSIYNHPWSELISIIDKHCIYNDFGYYEAFRG